MTRFVRPEAWLPIGIETLEPAAFDVVRSTTNKFVIAGPGAGKTELLAQRACYLLQTGFCPPPQRILAISFKRDAAKNLKDRVAQRAYPEHALRFDSFTFDSLAKNMLDRYFGALPEQWRPTGNYEIYFTSDRIFSGFLGALSPPAKVATTLELRAISGSVFEKRHIVGSPLPLDGIQVKDAASWAAKRWWEDCLHGGGKSRLTFPMIGRLVELLLRVNPQIRNALRATYSYVFMDEFQDTTHVQYDLVKTAFLNSQAVLTAVGDNKQQIMRWAMALDDAFGEFEKDFQAKRIDLVWNHRSSPDLVRIQRHIALAIDPNCKLATSMAKQDWPSDVCEVLEFGTPESEAHYLAETISSGVKDDDLAPRDFTLLVKQLPDSYAPPLVAALEKRDINARVEAELQDLLAERLTGLLVTFLRLGARDRAGVHWIDCRKILTCLRGIDPHDNLNGRVLQRELDSLHAILQTQMGEKLDSEKRIDDLFRYIVDFIGQDCIKLVYPEYRQGEWFESVLTRTTKYLAESCRRTSDWDSALDDFEGRNAVPIMTIHKSKGLEYHTVIFVGLDDSAWWSFHRQPEESRSAFFVAFSRAKQRVLFTYCEQRGGKVNISSLYEILRSAGVRTQLIKPTPSIAAKWTYWNPDIKLYPSTTCL